MNEYKDIPLYGILLFTECNSLPLLEGVIAARGVPTRGIGVSEAPLGVPGLEILGDE
ncbi:MAG: hypothetical protein HOL70_07520 [Candidatus Marinimicrobia bacterium]|nr:hypothetical protein [Candidatus Neomarinimicrobiota bacterium]